VLKDNSIAFEPPLPTVTVDAFSQLSSIVLNPVHLRFDQPFWDPAEELLSLGGSSGGWNDFLSMYTFTGEPLLVALPDPIASSALEAQTDAQVVASALSALRSKYGVLVPASPSSYMVTRWGLNPYARGTHSVLSATGTLADRSTLAEPVGGTLLFAGEAMHVTHPSSLQGAYWSGAAQAMRVVAAMQFPGNDSAGSNATCMADCYGSTLVPLPST
jgi:monoamine oxidase